MTTTYEYNVEYQCNGVKPDLPKSCIVQITNMEGKKIDRPRPVEFNRWKETKSFLIVDKRWIN